MAKKLLDQPYLKVQLKANAAESSSLSRLKKLLETADKSGKTPFLYSCSYKNCAAIELLAEAGADLKGTDNDGNTAIILVASSSSEDLIPSKEDSPENFKVVTKFGLLNHSFS